MMTRKFLLLIVVLLAMTAIAAPVAALPSTPEIVQLVKQMEQSLISGEGTTVVNAVQPSPPTPTGPLPPGCHTSKPASEQRDTFKWAFQSPEWRMEDWHSVGPDYPEDLHPFQSGYQGGMYRRYIPSLTAGAPGLMVVYPAARRVGIDPLFANYLGLEYVLGESKKLSDELVEAAAEVSGEQTINGVSTIVMTGKPPKRDSATWWLAPAYGYRVLKHEVSWTITSDSGYKKFTETRLYSDFSEVAPGVWLPKRTTVTKTDVKEDGSSTVSLSLEATTRFDSINKPVDPSKLTITPAEGTTIDYRDK